jgi:DUF1365 family protein
MLHERLEPAVHRFSYPVWYLAADLDRVGSASTRLFGYGRRAAVSLRDGDYLSGEGSLRDKVDRMLAQRGLSAARVVLVTVPRVLGRVFNPVSFYYCYGPEGGLLAALAEVNNTFKERHLYVLDPRDGAEHGPGAGTLSFRVPRDFHVSPFNDRRGDYRFRFDPLGERLDIGIDLLRDGGTAMRTRVWGKARSTTAPWGRCSFANPSPRP